MRPAEFCKDLHCAKSSESEEADQKEVTYLAMITAHGKQIESQLFQIISANIRAQSIDEEVLKRSSGEAKMEVESAELKKTAQQYDTALGKAIGHELLENPKHLVFLAWSKKIKRLCCPRSLGNGTI